jgi:hypothetical protein
MSKNIRTPRVTHISSRNRNSRVREVVHILRVNLPLKTSEERREEDFGEKDHAGKGGDRFLPEVRPSDGGAAILLRVPNESICFVYLMQARAQKV